MSHQCLVTLPGGKRCPAIIKNDDVLMDPAHWRNGAGRGGPDLFRAQDAAIAAVEDALLARAAEPRPGRRA